jgi:hypothetical protein
MLFGGGRKAGDERHNVMEAAFAVPATQTGRRGLKRKRLSENPRPGGILSTPLDRLRRVHRARRRVAISGKIFVPLEQRVSILREYVRFVLMPFAEDCLHRMG